MSSFSINTNHTERVWRLNREVAVKMKLERNLFRDLFTIYKKIASQGAILYDTTGRVLDISQFKDEIKTALVRHYKLVFKIFPHPFSVDLRKKLKFKQSDMQNYQIQQQQDEYISDRADQSAQQITDSTQKRWQKSLEAALLFLLLGVDERREREEVVTTRDLQSVSDSDRSRIAKRAVTNFNSTSGSRARTAATTETQSAAETNKNIIATNLLNSSGVFDGAKKMWMTILDGRERDSHNKSDGQRQSINSPYLVQGELLMYPGDITLGATASNVINCRCGSMIVVR